MNFMTAMWAHLAQSAIQAAATQWPHLLQAAVQVAVTEIPAVRNVVTTYHAEIAQGLQALQASLTSAAAKAENATVPSVAAQVTTLVADAVTTALQQPTGEQLLTGRNSSEASG